MRIVMTDSTQPQLSKTALLSFVLGVSSLMLSLVAAVPALCLGIQAIRAINHDDGRLRGRAFAVVGLALSAFSTVVTGVGLLALILLVVQEKNHVAGCANNLRQIGEAMNRYSDHHDRYFPPGTVPNPSLKPARRLSWEAAFLPYHSESGTAGKKPDKHWEKLVGDLAIKEAWDAPANAGLRQNVVLFLCPAFAHELSPDQVGQTAYVGVAGVGNDAASLPRSDANAGFFGYDRLVQAEDISARLDTTMAAIETMQDNGPWPAGGPPTVRGVAPDDDRYIGKSAAFGGLHRGGANVLWADGSVRILTEKISADLFRLESRLAR
jgi:prepilin-type processing-associated H-X9-DG protein